MVRGKGLAITWTVLIVFIGIIGLSGYASGTRYFQWFGIKLSLPGFVALLLVLIAFDVLSLSKAFGQNKQPQSSQPPWEANQDAERLTAPCTVNITRRLSLVGAVMYCKAYLNGREMGALKNGRTLTFTTEFRENELTIQHDTGAFARPFPFTATAGSEVLFDFTYTGAKLTLRDSGDKPNDTAH